MPIASPDILYLNLIMVEPNAEIPRPDTVTKAHKDLGLTNEEFFR